MTVVSKRRFILVTLPLGMCLAGCGPDAPAAFDQGASAVGVVVDLSALRSPPGETIQQGCASLAAEVVLRVEDESGAPQEFRRDVVAEAGVVRFDDIEVRQGRVSLTAEVLSDNQTTLYAGETVESISAATFDLSLPLEARTPVLQVCPGDIFLGRAADFTGTVQVHNRGVGTLTYQAISPECDQVPCFRLDLPSGSVAEEDVGQVTVTLVRIFPTTSLPLTVESPQGSVVVNVTLDRFPDLVVESFEATGTIRTNQQLDYEQPVRAVFRNQGNLTAGPFKIAAEYTDAQGQTFFTPFQASGQSDPSYAFIESLPAGAAVSLDGVVVFSSFFLNGATVTYRLETDSCSGDELFTPYCRVDEFDEGNNFSADLVETLPFIPGIP